MDTYEKKYKEALERAKKLQETCDSTAVVGWCEYIFPELKESEGEKIRKAICYILNHSASGLIDNTNFTVSQMEDWLEKQGEKRINYITTVEIPFGAKDSELQEASYHIPEGFHAEIEGDKVTIKKGEQKSFDYENANIHQKDFAPKKDTPRYSIGDILCDKSCTMLNKESQSNFEIIDIRNGMYICDKCSFPISQQDEYELVAKRIEQKPSWSEEDDILLSSIINTLDMFEDSGASKMKIDWLKSIKQRMAQ